MPSMTGTFQLIKSEYYESYLNAMGVGFLARQLLILLSPTITITNEGDEWNIKTTLPFGETTEIKFKLGQEFDEIAVNGRSCKSVITKEGHDKLVHVQKFNDAETYTTLREFCENEMKMTFQGPGNEVAYRTFEKL